MQFFFQNYLLGLDQSKPVDGLIRNPEVIKELGLISHF